MTAGEGGLDGREGALVWVGGERRGVQGGSNRRKKSAQTHIQLF